RRRRGVTAMLGSALAIADLLPVDRPVGRPIGLPGGLPVDRPSDRPIGLPVDFELPDDLIATEPVETSGGGREDARLMVAHRSDDRLVHTTFGHLGDFLDPGDLLVVN